VPAWKRLFPKKRRCWEALTAVRACQALTPHYLEAKTSAWPVPLNCPATQGGYCSLPERRKAGWPNSAEASVPVPQMKATS